jgi:hypothetical protein
MHRCIYQLPGVFRKLFECRLVLLLLALASSAAQATPIYQPPGVNLVYGDLTHGYGALSASTNPAAAAVELGRAEKEFTVTMMPSITAGIEYGNVQELFDFVDEISKSVKPSPPGTGGGSGQNPGDKEGEEIDMIIDTLFPDLRDTMDKVATEVAVLGSALAFIAVEGYAKAFAAVDIPVVVGKKMLGGAWNFNINYSGTTKAFGIAQPINFDFDRALAELEAAYNLVPGDPATEYDLTGDVVLRIDPNSGSVRLQMENDSLLLTKVATIGEFAVGYGRQVWSTDSGRLFLGGKAKYYSVGLSRASVRFGDITDSDELFDSIRHADLSHESGFGLDFGASWVAQHFLIGATLVNINEPDFDYPAVDTSAYTNQLIVDRLRREDTYTMEAQLRLESSVYTTDRRWVVNIGLDANKVQDPVGDDYQWATVSAGYATNKWWLPGVRFGYRKNLAGTELGYLGLGLTLLKYVNLDISSAVDTVDISGESLPRGLMLSLGFQATF